MLNSANLIHVLSSINPQITFKERTKNEKRISHLSLIKGLKGPVLEITSKLKKIKEVPPTEPTEIQFFYKR